MFRGAVRSAALAHSPALKAVRRAKAVRLAAVVGGLALGGCDQFARIGILDGDAGRDVGGLDDAGSEAGAGSDTPEVVRLSDCGPQNPAGLSADAIAALFQGGNGQMPQRLLYPYNGTVFPGGLTPPLVMWEGPLGDAVLLRLRSSTFEYTGCLRPTAPGQVMIPDRAWEGLQAASADRSEAVQLELTTLDNNRVTGPVSHTLKVASQALPISVYYMGYGATGTASIYRLRLGQAAERVFGASDCNGCHAANAQGTRLLDYAQGSGSAQCVDGHPGTLPQPIRSQLPGAELGALTPDGSLYVAPAHPSNVGTRARGTPLLEAALIDVESGVMRSGHHLPPGAMVPAFSSDGALLAFNDFAIDQGHGLAVMDFDLAAGAASNYREVYRDPTSYPAWPSFVQNARSIVFSRGSTADFSAGGAYILTQSGGSEPPSSDLYSADLEGGQASLLARAMGLPSSAAADEESYLPFGGDDLHKNYYPQAAPVTAGGYAWVFFDSIRHYGNQGSMRQIWGLALDLSGELEDPSHPPFYVPGQDAATANLRAVPALDPDPSATCSAFGD